MKIYAYSVFDEKAAAYLQPFFAPTRGLAIRSFADAVNDPAHAFHKHLADYTLFEVGEFDQNLGTFAVFDHAHNLGCALNFLEKDRSL